MGKGPDLHIKLANGSDPETRLYAPPPPDIECTHKVYQFTMPEAMLDLDAAKVVRRLSRFGFDAFLVGGSIRDTLFGVKPKDFDVATSALPAEIKRLFRNCRLIGRRFRLAHLLFRNNKIIEVATFRRSPTSEDDISDRHAAENLFGGPADDALRRDFTINALMYDVGRREIHDYVGGMQDIEARVLRTIGDPSRRFLEDPVRIIRAVKFAERLSLTMDPYVIDAARTHAPLVSECAPARLVEEVYKLLRTGRSAACFGQLHELGVLERLMPALHEELNNGDAPRVFEILTRADEDCRQTGPFSDVTMLSALLYPFIRSILSEKGDTASKIQKRVQELIHPMTFPKRCIAMVRQILAAQRRLETGPKTARARRILDRDYILDALDLLKLTADNDEALGRYEEWRKLAKRRKLNRAGDDQCTYRRKRRQRHRGNRRRQPEGTGGAPSKKHNHPPRTRQPPKS